MANRGERTNLYLDPKLKRVGRKLALDQHNESLSNYIERLIKADFERVKDKERKAIA